MKHATQNRWIWFRTTDKAIVYEQFYDNTPNSWVKFYEGGILANNMLFTQDFRIPKCTNPFMAMPEVAGPAPSIFLASFVQVAPMNLKKSDDLEDQFAEWIMSEYDTNKDGKLDDNELKQLRLPGVD